MKRFLERHRNRITGTLSGFDRMLFRGSLRSITHCKGVGDLSEQSPRAA
jgi:hypothetical protein